MSRQNLVPFDKSHAMVKVKPKVDKDGFMTGELTEEGQLSLSQNTQFLRVVLSQDGHATPLRTDDELTTLSTEQYIGRYAYNQNTDNAMVNVAGIYQNIMVSTMFSPLKTKALMHKRRLQFFVGKGSELFVSLNGVLHKVHVAPVEVF